MAQPRVGDRVLGGQPIDLGGAAGPLDEGLHVGAAVVGRDLEHQRVLGGEHAERHAERRVRTGRVHPERRAGGRPRGVGDRHRELGAFGAADPVALHREHAVGPVERVEVVEQLLGVVGDPEEPLLEVAHLHEVARALAGAVGQDLLVGQHGLAAGAPVHRRGRAVGQARLEEAQEDPLGPADVGRDRGW